MKTYTNECKIKSKNATVVCINLVEARIVAKALGLRKHSIYRCRDNELMCSTNQTAVRRASRKQEKKYKYDLLRILPKNLHESKRH